MRIKLLITSVIAALALSSVALAGSITISTSPNPVTVGSSFDVTICGLGGKTAEFRITAPDESVTEGQIYAPSCGTISVLADQSGEYLIEVLNKNGSHVYASTTETVN